MLGSRDEPYDILIAGAGPAGLTAAIIGARYRFKVLICEKSSRPAPFPRGETLHNAQIFTEVLGDNVLNIISQHITAARRFNSPNCENTIDLYRSSPSIVYEWDRLIALLVNRATEAGAKMRTNAEVKLPIIENKVCIGFELITGEKIFGKTILACDGHFSALGTYMKIDYSSINCPMIKRIVSNFHSEYFGFEYFFLSLGQLSFAPKFPPAILYIFPRGTEKAEVGLMVLTDVALELKNKCEIPNEEEMLRVWNQLLEHYPRFSDLMKDTTLEFEGITMLPTAKMIENFVPTPGLFIVGDAAGFVEASGASGIASSMQHAKLIVDFLYNNSFKMWTRENATQAQNEIVHSKIYKHIKNTYRTAHAGKHFIFVKLRTAEMINRRWYLIQGLYKLKS